MPSWFSSELSPALDIADLRNFAHALCSGLDHTSSETFCIRLVCRRWHFRKGRHQCGDARNDLQQSPDLRSGKARVDNMVEKDAQWGPVATDVDEEHRLVVQP